jgi:hypothetical protein
LRRGDIMNISNKFKRITLDISIIIVFVGGLLSLSIGIKLKEKFYLIEAIFLLSNLILGFLYYYNKKNPKVHKPSNSEWDNLKSEYCYHYTSSEKIKGISIAEGVVYLKPTISLFMNVPVLFRSSVYFFIGHANEEQIKKNLLESKKDYVINVKIGDLDKNKVRIRSSDKALIYIGSYIGEGEIREALF